MSQKNEFFLSIDPGGSKRHAYSILDHNENVFRFGIMRSNFWIYDLKEIVEEYNIKTAFIEDQYVGKNARASIKLAHKTGALIGVLQCLNVETILINPNEWVQAYLRKKGRWIKREVYLPIVLNQTKNFFNLNFCGYNIESQKDICCAIQIGLYGVRRQKSNKQFINK